MSEHNKATLQKANLAITQGEYEQFLSYCTDDTEWTFVSEKTLKGKEAVRKWMANSYHEPPKFTVTELIAEGDFVTALGNMTMKDKNGEPKEYAYCDVWRFRDGKMAELKAFVIQVTNTRDGHGQAQDF